ncbi:phage portal protein [Enterococcus italicus]|uniref:phage portal protein n=1 Tax=Enterococcus italicus TaxID=246144 RepID=UPI002074694F|nr:phage portal protein [Enterococcus italicus]
MEIEVVKKIIKRLVIQPNETVVKTEVAEKYYKNENDILRLKNPVEEKSDDTSNPLRNADNRISHPWHQLLVDQKASYTMAVPPTFDVDDDEMNENIDKVLGDIFPKVAKELAVNASNAGIAWLHVWKDDTKKGDMGSFFRYAVVDSKQIIPVFSKSLDKKLEGVLRVYQDCDTDGDKIVIYEYWNETECETFYRKASETIDDGLQEYEVFNLYDISSNQQIGTTNVYVHEWEEIPFIPFRNNHIEQNDLAKIKKQIDVYDKVYSGFVNDVDDIQEIIFVLTNYSGTDKQEFLNDLKKYKMVKVEDDDDSKGGVDTLAIDIPIEARAKLLEITREAIFVLGQGVDPQKNIGQNNSGVALKQMYSLLELKASGLETEFRIGFAELVRFILRFYGKDPDITIKQTWTRTQINNDLEQADIIAKLAASTSKENIAKSNPLVEDWQAELDSLEKEQDDDGRMENDYRNNKTTIEDE